MMPMAARAAIGVVLALPLLAACGKKPDFPTVQGGAPTPRLYPDPTLDPGYIPPVAPEPRPAVNAPSPATLPQAAPEDVLDTDEVPRPVDPSQQNPGEPAGPTIPPGIASPTTGQ